MAAPSILIVSAFCSPEPSGNAPFVTGFAEHLAALGNSVTVLTGYPHYPHWRRMPHEGHELEGVRVLRRWHTVPSRLSLSRRAFYELSLLVGGVVSLAKIRRPDLIVVYSSNLSDLLIARVARWVYGRPYVVVVQDLVGPGLRQTGMARFPWIAGAVARVELGVIGRAARVGIVAEAFRSYLTSGGVRPSRIRRVRNWARARSPISAGVQPASNGHGPPFRCVHAGNMGIKQGLDVLLDTAARLRDRPVAFVLAGDGNARAQLEERARTLSLPNLEFLPSLSDEEYGNLLGSADALLLTQLPSVTDMAFPSKLASYLSAGRPVIAAVATDSEAAAEIEAAAAGLVVPAGDGEALADAVMRLSRDKELRERCGANGQAFAAATLSKEACLRGVTALLPRRFRGQDRRLP